MGYLRDLIFGTYKVVAHLKYVNRLVSYHSNGHVKTHSGRFTLDGYDLVNEVGSIQFFQNGADVIRNLKKFRVKPLHVTITHVLDPIGTSTLVQFCPEDVAGISALVGYKKKKGKLKVCPPEVPDSIPGLQFSIDYTYTLPMGDGIGGMNFQSWALIVLSEEGMFQQNGSTLSKLDESKIHIEGYDNVRQLHNRAMEVVAETELA